MSLRDHDIETPTNLKNPFLSHILLHRPAISLHKHMKNRPSLLVFIITLAVVVFLFLNPSFDGASYNDNDNNNNNNNVVADLEIEQLTSKRRPQALVDDAEPMDYGELLVIPEQWLATVALELGDNGRDADYTGARRTKSMSKDAASEFSEETSASVPSSVMYDEIQRRALQQLAKYLDPKTITPRLPSNDPVVIVDQVLPSSAPPLHVCGRAAVIDHDLDMHIMNKYTTSSCPSHTYPPKEITVVYLGNVYHTYGQTGNNLIELLHVMQYAHDHNYLLAMKQFTWPIYLITMMWLEFPNNNNDGWGLWKQHVEQALCVKIVNDERDLHPYKEVIHMENTKELFFMIPTDNGGGGDDESSSSLDEYIEYQSFILRGLFRSYNRGLGLSASKRGNKYLPSQNMCSSLESIFGVISESGKNNSHDDTSYTVIHSRSQVGHNLKAVARRTGTHIDAAMKMEPEYIKSIIRPLGMLTRPIIYIGDGKQPEVLARLLADTEIGPFVLSVPNDASWVGGDITLGTMSTVFIGNPGSTFSGFIAKSRLALGFTDTYMFRKWDKEREGWVNSCDNSCIFDKKVMSYHA